MSTGTGEMSYQRFSLYPRQLAACTVVALIVTNCHVVAETEVGDTVAVTLIRDGEEMTASVTLGERPDQSRG